MPPMGPGMGGMPGMGMSGMPGMGQEMGLMPGMGSDMGLMPGMGMPGMGPMPGMGGEMPNNPLENIPEDFKIEDIDIKIEKNVLTKDCVIEVMKGILV